MSGPFGTVLEERAKALGIPDLPKAARVVDGGSYRTETLAIARGYLDRGADVATTNTFGLRSLLRHGDIQTYKEAVAAQVNLTREALDGFRDRNLVVNLGPFGVGPNGGCYNPDEAPVDAKESKDFHAEQLAVVRPFLEAAGVDAIIFETICTGREGLGVALAARELIVPVIPSFVIDKDARLFSGEPLVDVLRQIDDATGNYPLGYSVNCCPVPGAFEAIAGSNGKRDRLVMAYPNASERDPRELEELDGVVHLHDNGVTAEQLISLTRRNPSIKIVGGCCGFDHDDIGVISQAVRRCLT